MTTKIKSFNIDQSTPLALSNVSFTSITANGSVGAKGDVLASDGANVYWSSVAGTAGAKGDKGDTGTNGIIGVDGDKGDKGEPGTATDKGDKGDQGGAGAYSVTFDSFTGNGSNSTFTLSRSPLDENHTIVVLNGVVQLKSTYGVSGQTLTLGGAVADGAGLEVMTLSAPEAIHPFVLAGM